MHKPFPSFHWVYTLALQKSENIFGFILFLLEVLQNNINPSFLFWRSQQHSLSLRVPSAAIKRCRVSECNQLLCKGSAVVLERNQHSCTSLADPPRAAELRQEPAVVVKVTFEQKGFQRPSALASALRKLPGFVTDRLHRARTERSSLSLQGRSRSQST